MTTVENATTQASAPSDEIYDPDDVGPRDSPMLKPMRPNLQPSPSPPPAVPLPQVSPDSSPGGRKGSNRSKNRPSQGDAVLVSFMDGGKRPDIAREAGIQALASDDEDSEDSLKGTEITMDKETDRDGPRQELDLMALAAGAVKAHNEAHTAKGNLANETFTQKNSTTSSNVQVGGGEPMEGVKQAIPSITTNIYGNARSHVIADIALKVDSKTSPQPAGELPPILEKLSPQSGLSNGNGTPITLPGLRDQLGDINHLEPSAADPAFAQSPQARPPPRFSTATGQGSPPPRSPLDIRRELPSPGRGAVGSVGHYYQAGSNYRRPSQSEGAAYGSGPDYSSSNTETPSTDQSTPATLVDRMSIDGITNPQIGGFQCTYPGCTAQPFQTQYLLNSHANVHSSNRPHYCQVKGCPRSEGGKGFKRKNEMIRHGLVHDSPGYVCPFCPDREHKYPRPDNLQRHVRVHHVDKDKDDPQLREVLSQRPEGPSRGRRRRGGTS